MAYRHHYHRPDWHRPPCRPRRGGAGKRVLYILAVGVVVAAAVSMFRGGPDRYVSPPPAPARMAEMRVSKLPEYASDSGIIGGAAAAEKALAARPPHPDGIGDPNRTVPVNVSVPRSTEVPRVAGRPAIDLTPGKPTPAIKRRVKSDKLYTNRDMALNDALIKAGSEIHDALRALDPPVEGRPGWSKVKADYLRPESVTYPTPSEADKKALAEAGLDPNGVWAEIDVEVTDDQVRELRAESRTGTAGVAGAVGFVLVLALFGFLRLDAWTRGYLTGGLAVAIVAAAGAAVALLVLA